MHKILRAIRWMIPLAVLTLWVSFAASIDGTWIAHNKNGSQTLMLKSSGNVLTGNLDRTNGRMLPISNGKIDGNHVSFRVVRPRRRGAITREFNGTVSGSELKLTITGGPRGTAVETFRKQ